MVNQTIIKYYKKSYRIDRRPYSNTYQDKRDKDTEDRADILDNPMSLDEHVSGASMEKSFDGRYLKSKQNNDGVPITS